jgi:PREDICTED: apoptotic chromatin condensation inducer 1-like
MIILINYLLFCHLFIFTADGNKSLDSSSSRDKSAPDSESTAKLLDDLFKKTKTTPCIYWLPLDEDQAKKRAEIRANVIKKRDEEWAAREANRRSRYDERTRSRRATSPYDRRVCIDYHVYYTTDQLMNNINFFLIIIISDLAQALMYLEVLDQGGQIVVHMVQIEEEDFEIDLDLAHDPLQNQDHDMVHLQDHAHDHQEEMELLI